jgi:hypothetical protein
MIFLKGLKTEKSKFIKTNGEIMWKCKIISFQGRIKTLVGNVKYEGLGLGSCDVESNYITNLLSFKSLYKFCVRFDFHGFVQRSHEFFVIKIF